MKKFVIESKIIIKICEVNRYSRMVTMIARINAVTVAARIIGR